MFCNYVPSLFESGIILLILPYFYFPDEGALWNAEHIRF